MTYKKSLNQNILGNYKAPTRLQAIKWVSIFLEALDTIIVVKSFRLCGIENKTRGKYNEILMNICKNLKKNVLEEFII